MASGLQEPAQASQDLLVSTDAMVLPSDSQDKAIKTPPALPEEPETPVTGNLDLDEPQITPIRARSPPPSDVHADRSSNQNDEDLRGRSSAIAGSVILSNAAKKKKKRKNKPDPVGVAAATNTVRGFTPVDSAAEDSDSSAWPSPRMLSPARRFPASLGSPLLRPASPGVSSLRTQLEALNASSRSSSRARAVGSETTSPEASDAQDDSTEEIVSYDIHIEQDFISQSIESHEDMKHFSPDQKATSILRKMTADDFTPIRCLGDGAFGTVLLVRQNATGRLFAQKTLTKASLKIHKRVVDRTMSERQILELVNRQPFIVNLYYAFQDHERLYLILQYASGGELFRHLELEKFFSEEVAAFYIAEIVLALDFLHNTVGIIYRDLKPENCLLDADGHLLLTDFGLSKVAVKDASTPGGSRCNSLGVGTIEYMAPELIRNSDVSDFSGAGYGIACDWWSLGAMACDLMTGKPPFGGGNWTKIQQNIMHQKLNLPYFLSADARDLLTRLLRKEPKKRLGVGPNDINLIKKHRFFRKIDWKKLEAREIEPPIKPFVTDPALGENFAAEFTERSVDEFITKHNRALSKSDPFGGFSYVASRSFLEQSLLGEIDEDVIDEETN